MCTPFFNKSKAHCKELEFLFLAFYIHDYIILTLHVPVVMITIKFSEALRVDHFDLPDIEKIKIIARDKSEVVELALARSLKN